MPGSASANFGRKRALSRPVHSAADLTMIRELRRLGGLQKHMINRLLQNRSVTSECVDTIRALRAAVDRLANNDR